MVTPYESAYRTGRIQYVRESTTGTFETDPAYNLYSDTVREFEAVIDPQMSGQRGLNDPDVQNGFAGMNADEITLAYDLQQKTSSGDTLHDNAGSPNDAVTDAFERNSDNQLQNTHQIERRYEQTLIDASETISGSTSRDTRQYIIGTGCFPNEATLAGDPSDGQPILVEITYLCESVRSYQVDQPTSSESPIELWVDSTDNSDDSQSITVEDEGAGTSESISLNGTTDVQSSNTYSDVDTIELSAETSGDVRIYVDDGSGTSAGDQIAVIQGQDSRDPGEGDLGVPALGSGSNASAIDQNFELYHDDAIDRPDGTSIGENFETTEISVSNNVDPTPHGGSARPALSARDRELTADVTVFGQTQRYQHTRDLITSQTDHLRFNFTGPTHGGWLQLNDTYHTDVSAPESVRDSKLMSDLSLVGTVVDINASN